MSGAIIVFNIGDEDGICTSFLPYWRKSGCDIIFSSPVDCPSRIPSQEHIHVGKKLTGDHKSWWVYQSRVLETMKLCLKMDHSWFCFTQYDSVCFGELPPPEDNQCVTAIAGYGASGQSTPFFVHPPWMFGRTALSRFVEESDRHPITIENGIMDSWMSYILIKANIPIHDCLRKWSWTCNSIDTPHLLELARNFYQKGGLFIHGCKNLKTLEAIIA
jgi:hypothetical protein